jgi:sugar/nucleoside kinase (ribokinase family)
LAAGAPVDSEDDQLAAACQLIEMTGCDGIFVTRGEHGVIVVTASGGSASFAATARRVMDVSGAGDTLVAGFTLALASGASIMNAARLGPTKPPASRSQNTAPPASRIRSWKMRCCRGQTSISRQRYSPTCHRYDGRRRNGKRMV